MMLTTSDATVACLYGTLFGSLVFLTPIWGPRLAFRGLAAHADQRLPTFTMGDFLVLIGFLSVANAAASWLELSRSHYALVIAASNVLVVAVWLSGLQFMRRFGLKSSAARFAYQLGLHPAAIFGTSGCLFNALLLFNVAAEGIDWLRLGVSDARTAALGACSLAMFIACGSACVLARHLLVRLQSPKPSNQARI